MDPVTRQVVGWESTPIATAMAELEEQLATYFAGKYGDDTQEKRDDNTGRTLIDESYYLALSQGMVMTADPCPNLKNCKVGVPNSAAELAKGVVAVGKGVNTVAQVLAEEFLIVDQKALWQAVKILRAPTLATEADRNQVLVNGVPKTKRVSPFEYIATRSGSLSIFKSGHLEAVLYTTSCGWACRHGRYRLSGHSARQGCQGR